MPAETSRDIKEPDDQDLNNILKDVEKLPELQQIPENQREQVVKAVVEAVCVKAEFFSGPLPPPQIIKGYDAIVPGSANIIIDSFVQQSEHRRNIETQVTTSEIKRAERGQNYAFIIVLLLIIAAGYGIYKGHTWVAVIFGGPAIIQIVSMFISGKSLKKRKKK